MKNMEISDLKYLVFEGGGAKGTAYIGAIQGLESKFKEGTIDTIPENKTKCSILDYSKGKENKKPQIEGIAGTSAGAITAFALALGLNSEEIEEVSNYDFTNFLSEEDVGFYRMVGTVADNGGKKYQLYIGEDKEDKLHNSKVFKYKFDEYTDISDNYWGTELPRSTLLHFIMSVIIDGIISQADQIKKFFGGEKPLFNIELPIGAFRMIESAHKPALYNIAFILLAKLLPGNVNDAINLDYARLGNLLWDRGIFSGFAVREFFFDVLIYSLSKDTHFRRGLIEILADEAIKKKNADEGIGNKNADEGIRHIRKIFREIFRENEKDRIKDIFKKFKSCDKKDDDKEKIDDKEKRKKDCKGKGFLIGSREDYDFDDNLKIILTDLSEDLTFKRFHTITGIDFGLAITNSTTGASLYYSHKHTPDFPVLEAVAASMNIPGVFKPIYSEADVWIPENYYKNLEKYKQKKNDKSNSPYLFNSKGKLCMRNYYLFELAVKKFLSKGDTNINTNISLNESGYLAELRKIITDNINKKEKIDTIPIEGYKYDITLPLLAFFYNAAYKGLLVDGGVANNIPYNFFRNTDDKHKLEGVLALKLDNEFPPDFFKDVYPAIETYFKDLRKHKLESLECVGQEGCMRRLQLADLASKRTLLLAIKNSNPELNKLKEKEIDKIFKDLTENFRDTEKGETPWNKATSIFNVIGGMGWDYGSEHGQVRYFSDHEHIIPLYTYGVTTMDFDLTLIPNFSDMSRKKAKEAVVDYFGTKKEK